MTIKPSLECHQTTRHHHVLSQPIPFIAHPVAELHVQDSWSKRKLYKNVEITLNQWTRRKGSANNSLTKIILLITTDNSNKIAEHFYKYFSNAEPYSAKIIQHYTTKLSYPERLRILHLDTLDARRIKSDLKLCFKIINNLCGLGPAKFFLPLLPLPSPEAMNLN